MGNKIVDSMLPYLESRMGPLNSDQHEDEDDEGGSKDPTAHLKRQLRRIRNGEEVDRLRVPVRAFWNLSGVP